MVKALSVVVMMVPSKFGDIELRVITYGINAQAETTDSGNIGNYQEVLINSSWLRLLSHLT